MMNRVSGFGGKQAQVLPGHLVTVLQVIVAPQLDLAIRQAASIHFKQILSKGWEPKEGIWMISHSLK